MNSSRIQETLRHINKVVSILYDIGSRMHLELCIGRFCRIFEANEHDFWKSFNDANNQVLICPCPYGGLDEDRQIRLRMSTWDSEPEEQDDSDEQYDFGPVEQDEPDEHGQRFGYDPDY